MLEHWQRITGGLLVAIALVALAACSNDEDGPNTVNVRVTDSAVDIPGALAPGFTTFNITGESEGDNHLIFLRGNDGVTQEAMDAGIRANDGSGDSLVSIVGGNGGMPQGTSVKVTFELEEGIYSVILFTDEGDLAAHSFFTVDGSADSTAPPAADGVIAMGPGFRFALPSGFNGTGTFEVVNNDTETHEAAFVRLEDGHTMSDVRDWALNGFEGPPPLASAGGFGALDGGRRGWIEADTAPGQYALICWIPDADGVPHWLNGMSTEFSVN